MKTVDKALAVLDQFSFERTEIGLSELARMAELDKAATRRLLVALSKHGFIEQNEETRRYRLGSGFLRLARIREATVPIRHAAQEAIDWLVAQTNETAHASIPGSAGMVTIAHRLPNRARVVNIEPAQVLHFHATASGLIFLAHATEATTARVFALKRERFAASTVVDEAELRALLDSFRAQGYSQTYSSFEDDVASLGMSFCTEEGDPRGSIALALPKADLTDARRDVLLPLLREAVAQIEAALTGA
ncbi:IclR family transcriptional regulator [Roseobacteraceae bacterium S113]